MQAFILQAALIAPNSVEISPEIWRELPGPRVEVHSDPGEFLPQPRVESTPDLGENLHQPRVDSTLDAPPDLAQEAPSQPSKSVKETIREGQEFFKEELPTAPIPREEKNGREPIVMEPSPSSDPIRDIIEASSFPKDIQELTATLIDMRNKPPRLASIRSIISILATYPTDAGRRMALDVAIGGEYAIPLPYQETRYAQGGKNTKMDLDHNYNMDEVDEVLFGEQNECLESLIQEQEQFLASRRL
jgi:hypothetical protein